MRDRSQLRIAALTLTIVLGLPIGCMRPVRHRNEIGYLWDSKLARYVVTLDVLPRTSKKMIGGRVPEREARWTSTAAGRRPVSVRAVIASLPRVRGWKSSDHRRRRPWCVRNCPRVQWRHFGACLVTNALRFTHRTYQWCRTAIEHSDDEYGTFKGIA
jgi:hypothetical protein